MLETVHGAETMQSATGQFRHGYRTEHVMGLKRLVRRLVDAVERAHQQLRAL